MSANDAAAGSAVPPAASADAAASAAPAAASTAASSNAKPPPPASQPLPATTNGKDNSAANAAGTGADSKAQGWSVIGSRCEIICIHSYLCGLKRNVVHAVNTD